MPEDLEKQRSSRTGNLYGYSDEQLEGFGRNPIKWRGTPEQEAALADYYQRKERKALAGTQERSGQEFGDRMRRLAEQTPASFRVYTGDIDKARQLTAESYGRQQQATGLMRAAAMGQGPSAAAVQGQMAQDQLMRNQMAQGASGLRAGLMSGQMNTAVGQMGQARAQEIGAAQQGWAQSAATQRGQSLQDYGQGLTNAYNANKLALSQMGQNLEREMKLQNLSLGAYTSEAAYRNAMLDAQLGYYGNEVERQMAQQAAAMQAGASTGAAMLRYGFSGGGGGHVGHGGGRPNFYDRSQWAPGSEDYYSDERLKAVY